MFNKLYKIFLPSLVAIFLTACGSAPVKNPSGISTVYQDVDSPGVLRGIGIESQDIRSMVDQMVRHMLANPLIGGAARTPRVIVDAQYFKNESSQPINKNILIDQLATQLQIAANGRVLFIDRENEAMILAERNRKRADTSATGATDLGSTGIALTQAGVDYRLNGRITSLDARTSDGTMERYINIVFRMTDLETGVVAWTNQYSFKKVGQDDIIYR